MAAIAAFWQINPEHSGIEIRFPSKPADEVLIELQQACFRWHRAKKMWYHKDTVEARRLAQKIAKKSQYKNAKEGPKCMGIGQKWEEEPNHALKPGDILHTSWGYDQTNVEWYIVYQIIGKRYFLIKQIGAKAVEGSQGFMSESRLPEPERVLEGEPEKAYCGPMGRMHVVEEGYQRDLHLWDGKPKYCSWYA